MADPVVLEIPEWEWTLVASAVTSGVLNRLSSTVRYYQTYRATGGTAPSNPTVGSLPEEATQIFEQSNQAVISNSVAIDVYILCANSDNDSNESGKVRVDL